MSIIQMSKAIQSAIKCVSQQYGFTSHGLQAQKLFEKLTIGVHVYKSRYMDRYYVDCDIFRTEGKPFPYRPSIDSEASFRVCATNADDISHLYARGSFASTVEHEDCTRIMSIIFFYLDQLFPTEHEIVCKLTDDMFLASNGVLVDIGIRAWLRDQRDAINRAHSQ